MAREWFINNGDAVEGPIGSSELRKRAAAGSIQPATPIRLGADGEWMPAGRVRDLFSPVKNSGAPSGAASEGVTQAIPTPAEAPQPRGRLTNTQALILGSALVVSVLIASAAIGLAMWFQSRTETAPANSVSLSWATVIEAKPDPAVVTDAAARARMEATGLPWKVRDSKTGIVMLLCPPGEFTMGSPASEAGRFVDETQHRRKIRNAFYLSQTEVTQEMWEKVMGANPSYFKGATKPVEQVSWDDCVRFCESTGLRLPTEAEWEYACRAGTTGAYAGDLASMACFADNSGRKPLDAEALWKRDQKNYLRTLLDNGCQTHPVRQRKPNAWGLYDMHGNVWEWVADAYAEYPKGGGTEEAARAAEGGARVLRGGGWSDYDASNCRAAIRNNYPPWDTGGDFGFRVARNP